MSAPSPDGTTLPEPPEAPASAPAPPGAGLQDPLLDDLPLPSRLLNWASAEGLTTLLALARLPPQDLLRVRSLGRLTIARGRRTIEALLGCSWEEFAARERAWEAREAPTPEDLAPRNWDELRVGMPEALRTLPLEAVPLVPRLRAYAIAEGLHTVGELATRSEAELLLVPHVGRRAVQLTYRAVGHALIQAAARHELIDARVREATERERSHMEARRRLVEAGLLESWKTLIAELTAARSSVVTLRAGLGGRAETLGAIGKMLGRSRERMRQQETRAVETLAREDVWLSGVGARVDAALPEGAVPLAALAADPWWAGMVALPEALDYFGERILGGAVRVIEVDEQLHLARCSQTTLDTAWSDLRASAAAAPVPAPLQAFRALLGPVEARVGPFLARALWDRLRARFHVDESTGEPRVTGFGGTHATAMVALLRVAPAPMRLDELKARAGCAQVPDELLWFGPALVGLPQHFPDLDGWIDRLVPAALRVMERDAPERQWSAGELRAEMREDVALPDWLTEWHLSSALRRSGRIRYLGRRRFAAPESAESQGRILFQDELLRILRDLGRPLTRGEIVAEVRRKASVSETVIKECLWRPWFVRCDAERFGLVERDLPGGVEARAEATAHVARIMERRRRGLGPAELCAAVTRLGPAHARWTKQMCLSVMRGDAQFRRSSSGAVGLAGWDSVRVPTRRELVRRCLEEAGGKVRVSAVQRRVVACYGEAPDRSTLGSWANPCGARIRGAWIVREET